MIDRDLQRFTAACGAAGPLVLGVDEPGADRTSWRIFDQPFAVVGRAAGVDLMLGDPLVSRRHAYFQIIDGRVFCVDLQSRTGTRWGEDSAIWGWVDPEAGVNIGPYRVRIKGSASANLPAVIGDGADSTPAMPTSRGFRQGQLADFELEIRDPAGATQEWRISRSLVLIGQSRACKLRLQGEGIAAIHAAILLAPDGPFVIDLLGTGGTLLNGRPVRSNALDLGDVISVGRYQILLRPALAVPACRASAPARAAATTTTVSRSAEFDGPTLRSLVEEYGLVQRESDERFQEMVLTILRTFADQHREQMDLTRESLVHLVAIAESQRELTARLAESTPVTPPALHLVSGDSRVADVTPRHRRPGRGAPTMPRRAATEPSQTRMAPADPDLPTLLFDRLAELQAERTGRWQRLMGSLLGKTP